MRSPKRRRERNPARPSFFRYYASFSHDFVEDSLDLLELEPRSILLDPWLGAGVTSEIAVRSGYRFRGYDINPAMLFVAKARTLASDQADEVLRLAGEEYQIQRRHDKLIEYFEYFEARKKIKGD